MNAVKYVISWLQLGKHVALNKEIGLSRKRQMYHVSKSSELFL